MKNRKLIYNNNHLMLKQKKFMTKSHIDILWSRWCKRILFHLYTSLFVYLHSNQLLHYLLFNGVIVTFIHIIYLINLLLIMPFVLPILPVDLDCRSKGILFNSPTTLLNLQANNYPDSQNNCPSLVTTSHDVHYLIPSPGSNCPPSSV